MAKSKTRNLTEAQKKEIWNRWSDEVLLGIHEQNHQLLREKLDEGLKNGYKNFTFYGKTLLHIAVEAGNLAGTKIILSKKPELLNKKDSENRTALDYAEYLFKLANQNKKKLSNINDCAIYLKNKVIEYQKTQLNDDSDDSDEDKAQIDTEQMLDSDKHTFDKAPFRANKKDFEQFVYLRTQKREDGSIKYVMKFDSSNRPDTEHGTAQHHHITAYSLITESIAAILEGKDVEKAEEFLLVHVIKYAPSKAKLFLGSVEKYRKKHDESLNKSQRDLIALTDKRCIDFFKTLRGSDGLSDAEKQELEHVLTLAEERMAISDSRNIKNKIKAGDHLERFSDFIGLISEAVSCMNQEPDITFNKTQYKDGGSKSGSEWAAKFALKKGENVVDNSLAIFDYPPSLFKEKGSAHYRKKLVKHLSIIHDTYPNVLIDETFVKKFLDADGISGDLITKKSIEAIVKDVENFEANAIASYQVKYGPKPALAPAPASAGSLIQKAPVIKGAG